MEIPPPPQKFEGKIERNAAQSTPYWPMRVVPPKGAPNILLIMTDDTGFGVTSTFGGVVPTPPTRAAIITGRNHHSMGFGVVAEQSTGYPGYNSIMTRDKATIGRILKDNDAQRVRSTQIGLSAPSRFERRRNTERNNNSAERATAAPAVCFCLTL
jgi:hypothetical protein